ncbi:MAG: dCTP deaminase [Candidatus Pacebacteria bacterium]|nr:dCTP deaminase [Candidatus Paceibacterota bacterium]PIR63748.1 MAG: dCTP deaminase [Candidatus Pacebacteria bacterium CG10_big_fil_rev_8_21_14_0_10_40_26]PIZ78534.1 MAG: dCTP deaminase [Candidatus Pacebacteria bacterium CG_4_10_14_0_2_um_filter_40_20]PJA69385.1 MAG: dCTP deaminase [Candidatus Pacebacteria bacterium CG_4_9_14_3_um_filter_40_12]PJC41402.1 MAG: dCTP deaminase [Candidatus Pacebacteria bacterium CG_4_9_14_0_2_um_filter_40_15]
MPVLTHDEIKKEIEKGTLTFSPPISDDQISVASVDLHLAPEFRVFEKGTRQLDLVEETNYMDCTREVLSDSLFVKPGETVLGVTTEIIGIPSTMCGWLEGRSRFARLGLLIHISAGFIQPGVANRQVLEITNLSPNTLVLHAGERLCQIIFQRCEGEATYSGRFVSQ